MSFILPAVCLLIIAADLLFAFGRGFTKTLIRLATVVLSAALSFFIAPAVAGKIGPKVMEALRNLPEAAPFLSYFEEHAEAADAMTLFCRMLVAPALFLALYLIFKLVTLVVYAILSALFGKIGDKHRLLALLPGALCAVIGVSVFLVPVMGYLTVSDRVMTISERLAAETKGAGGGAASTGGEAGSTGGGEAPAFDAAKAREKYLSPMLHAPVVSGLYEKAGAKLFIRLSGGKIGGEQTDLLREIGALSDILSDFSVLRNKQMTAYGETEAAAVSATVTHLSASPMLKTTLAGFLSGAAKNWQAGEAFLGMQKPSMGANGDIVLSGFLTVFETTDSEKLPGDLTSFSNIFNLMVEYRVFERLGEDSGEGNFLLELEASGFLSELKKELDANPRMQPVKDAIYKAATRALIEQLGVNENFKEACAPVLADLTAALRATPRTEKGGFEREALKVNISAALAKNEITLSDTLTDLVGQGVDGFFAGREVTDLTALTDDAVMDLLSEFLTGAKAAQ